MRKRSSRRPPIGSARATARRVVYASDGDLFLYDFSTDARAVSSPRPRTRNRIPQFTHDEKRVAFTRGGNLYVMSLETGMLEQMTEIVAGGRDPRLRRRRRSRRRPRRTRRRAAPDRGRAARNG